MQIIVNASVIIGRGVIKLSLISKPTGLIYKGIDALE